MSLVSPEQFTALLKNRKRQLVLTWHAKARSVQRLMDETVITRDLYTETPLRVAEQPSETAGERKFDVYYLQHTGVYHRYVVCLNNSVRVITVMRVSRRLQERFRWLK